MNKLTRNFLLIKSKFFKNGSFVNNVTLLVSGSAMSQMILFAISPVITRLFDPTAFGYYATYTAIATIGGGIVGGKYNLALVLPKEEVEANDLLRFAVGIALLASGFVFLAVLLAGENVAVWIGMRGHYELALLVPLSLLLLGVMELYKNWRIRNKSFKIIAISSISHISITAVVQITIAVFLTAEAIGLVLGQIIGGVIGLVVLLPKRWAENFWFRNARIKEMFTIAGRYKDFPQYMIISGLINRMNTYIPIFVFGYFFSPAVVGLYALSQRVIKAPMGLIGGSVATVFIKKSHELATTDSNRLRKKTFQMSLTLFIIGLLPTGILLFFSPPLFSLFFGNKWEMAGSFTQAMSVYLLLQFAFTPLAVLFRILEKQKIYSLWEMLRFIICLCATVIGGMFLSPLGAVMIFSVGMSFSYIVLAYMSYYILKESVKRSK